MATSRPRGAWPTTRRAGGSTAWPPTPSRRRPQPRRRAAAAATVSPSATTASSSAATRTSSSPTCSGKAPTTARVRSRRVTGRRLTRRGAGCWTASPRTRDTGQRPTATTTALVALFTTSSLASPSSTARSRLMSRVTRSSVTVSSLLMTTCRRMVLQQVLGVC
ncbi:hypothetical protein DAI22_05g135500 [Oryza sativa Japonica Group]|nr:hypothetical protein DAI22_05g135500 [Oryza sativa Japonica Group]